MSKDKVIEFLFNEKKYRVEKFVILLFFGIVFGYIVMVFEISLLAMNIIVLTFVLIRLVLQLIFYNKIKNIKTSAINWLGILICLIALIAMSFLYVEQMKLKNAAYDVIEDKVNNKSVTIEYVDEMDEENLYAIGYTVAGEDERNLEFYYWQDNEFIPENIIDSE
ncbi:hypothetical protein GCM10011351_00160 [Paraliobacillus quinghaiensis]|uniref:Uncharacterized protein n=1 Tax=Paraliobacillus quinghaiensis TaxID=470815 RepID=A0A917WP87_9BACI|nr:hypothetical protein [Paraliobacillus quinghaiensis]GGM18348.1 hypothetical protein GCM10011351_00160 [Paraliobacillus quinghaiensis]